MRRANRRMPPTQRARLCDDRSTRRRAGGSVLTMDDIVLRGMAKWPNVPAVYGWLALDRRGRWLIKGDPVGNSGISAFIGRNYARDDDGRWFFQNGPQRVYVTLEYTPLIYRALEQSGGFVLEAHTGARAAALHGAWIDEHGALIVETEHGP